VDPFDRFLRRPLDELLVGQGVLAREKADEMRAAAETAGEPFASVVVESGTLTPWDLARTIAVHYQMPVLPLAGYRFDKELVVGLQPETLHRYQVVPLGVFGATRTFAVIEPPSRALLDELTSACGTSIFFFAAEANEVARILREHVKVVDANADAGWQKLFDEAEVEVAKGLTPKKSRGAPGSASAPAPAPAPAHPAS
jgi:hypothetical protein